MTEKGSTRGDGSARRLQKIKQRLSILYRDAGDYLKLDDITWLVHRMERLEAELARCRSRQQEVVLQDPCGRPEAKPVAATDAQE